MASSSGLAKNLDEIRELIEQSIQDTRSLILEISPPILYELGFEVAVEWLVDRIEEQHTILGDFEDDRQRKPLDDDIRVLLFQAVRELLVNVVKHAQARKVKVFIRRDGDDIRVIIEDDGVGFDVRKIASKVDRTGGFGFFSIRERLNYVGGQLVVKSKPGQGTHIALVAPLKRHEGVTKRKAS